MISFAKNFWQEANPGVKKNMTVKVQELSITDFGTQAELEKDVEQRGKWIGMGDELVNKSSLIQRPKDISNTALAFEPQRIRQFLVQFEMPALPQAKPASTAPKEDAEAKKSSTANLGKNDHTNKDRITDKMETKEPKESREAKKETKEIKPSVIDGKQEKLLEIKNQDTFQQMPSQEFELLRI